MTDKYVNSWHRVWIGDNMRKKESGRSDSFLVLPGDFPILESCIQEKGQISDPKKDMFPGRQAMPPGFGKVEFQTVPLQLIIDSLQRAETVIIWKNKLIVDFKHVNHESFTIMPGSADTAEPIL